MYFAKHRNVVNAAFPFYVVTFDLPPSNKYHPAVYSALKIWPTSNSQMTRFYSGSSSYRAVWRCKHTNPTTFRKKLPRAVKKTIYRRNWCWWVCLICWCKSFNHVILLVCFFSVLLFLKQWNVTWIMLEFTKSTDSSAGRRLFCSCMENLLNYSLVLQITHPQVKYQACWLLNILCSYQLGM